MWTALVLLLSWSMRLPWWLSGKESACQWKRCKLDLWMGKIPWRRKWHSTPVFMPGKSHGQRSLVGYSPWGCKRVRRDLATEHARTQVFLKTLNVSSLECWLFTMIQTHTLPWWSLQSSGRKEKMLHSLINAVMSLAQDAGGHIFE